ncbi:MAG TPA: class I SAM-dependent methyltransferase [Planctomycetota bacterium]|nr:class I SAM-dependent methyltransferase [Planctomycetota bacterium]
MGTAAGYAFTKMLYATRYLGMESRVQVHAFDSFEGLPPPEEGPDSGLTTVDWAQGQFKGDYDDLRRYCDERYRNHRINKGYFEETLTEERLQVFREYQPLLVWIDCDYYSSTKTVFDRILPYLPNGCVIYFDDYEFNYGSRLTCEARFVHEFNHGLYGMDKELVLDRELSLDSRRVYRLVAENATRYSFVDGKRQPSMTARRRGNDSPLP